MAVYTNRKIWARECMKRGAVHELYEKSTYADIPQNNMLMYAVGERHMGLYGVWNPRTGEGTVYDKVMTQFDARNREFTKTKLGA